MDSNSCNRDVTSTFPSSTIFDSNLMCNNPQHKLTEHGSIPATKIILRCTNCNFSRSAIQCQCRYEYYPEIQPIVKCTQEAYMGRMLQRMIVSAGHHAWTSFESWGEIYNEVFKDSANTTETNSFFSKNPILRTAADDDHTCLKGYLTRKHVSEAFWNGEVENEWREHNYVFGQISKRDREVFMDMVDQKRAENPCPHKHCSEITLNYKFACVFQYCILHRLYRLWNSVVH